MSNGVLHLGSSSPSMNALPAGICVPTVIGLLSNPHSGGNKKGINAVRRFISQTPGIDHAEAVTPPDVRSALVEFAARGVNLIVVNGGDGTVQSVLTTLYGRNTPFTAPPLLALLEAGTTSMLAGDVGVRGTQLTALAKIHNWSTATTQPRHRIVERPVLKITQRDDTAPVCGMFFGAGVIPQGIDFCHGSINPNGMRGELVPGLIIARFLLAALAGNNALLSITDMGVRLDDTPTQNNRYLVAMVSSLERLFLGLHPFWGTETAPLHFTALKANPPYLLRNLPFLLRGRRTGTATQENGYFSRNAKQITFDFNGRFTLDGELFEAKSPVTIEAAGPARFLKL